MESGFLLVNKSQRSVKNNKQMWNGSTKRYTIFVNLFIESPCLLVDFLYTREYDAQLCNRCNGFTFLMETIFDK